MGAFSQHEKIAEFWLCSIKSGFLQITYIPHGQIMAEAPPALVVVAAPDAAEAPPAAAPAPAPAASTAPAPAPAPAPAASGWFKFKAVGDSMLSGLNKVGSQIATGVASLQEVRTGRTAAVCCGTWPQWPRTRCSIHARPPPSPPATTTTLRLRRRRSTDEDRPGGRDGRAKQQDRPPERRQGWDAPPVATSDRVPSPPPPEGGAASPRAARRVPRGRAERVVGRVRTPPGCDLPHP